ncbi:MAG: hypothetical protein WEA34_02705 [Gemmatimonadota bacterium]
MRHRPIRAIAAVTAAASFLAGCYTYRAAELSEVVPESRVRLTVSARQAVELQEALLETGRTFNATYVGETAGASLFSVSVQNPTPGMSSRALENRVSVPHDEVTAVELRELSRWRTAAVVAAGALAVGVGAWEAFGGGKNPRPDDKPPNVDNIRIPLFSLPWGR